MILVTGGAGFIGSNFVLDWLASSDEAVLDLDAAQFERLAAPLLKNGYGQYLIKALHEQAV